MNSFGLCWVSAARWKSLGPLDCSLPSLPDLLLTSAESWLVGIPIDSQLVKTANQYRTIIATTVIPSAEGARNLLNAGCEVLQCNSNNNHVSIPDLMTKLGSLGIDSLLLEGGGTLNAAFLEAGCVDEVWAFIAPKIIGGAAAQTAVSGKGIAKMSDAIQLQDIDIQNIKGDILIKGKICSRE